ncbi:MAG: DEAD/DEAH box helicase family protein, partial [Nitriliruptoraceae bacterium]|nr:DEAD/DEAH box helicase family protein [Nitriliruptoraceae bacterium]
MTRVPDPAIALLERDGSATVRDLLVAIREAGGHGVSRAALERALAADPRVEPDAEADKPRWQLTDGAGADGAGGRGSEVDGEPDASPRATADEVAQDAEHARDATRLRVTELDLRPWQVRALAAWSTTCRGVVEAVTGTGKTRLALAAVRSVVDAGGRALVLVPTLELLEQWVREVRSLLPDVTVGRLGGGGDDDLFACQVLIATPHSASSVPVDLPPRTVGLLVADEAHRYGAPTWGAALGEEFSLRLALTATYERGDEGIADVLEPYFGPVVYRYRYAEAAADGTIAPFRIALAGVRLTPGEAAAHAAADTRVRQLHRELIGPLGMPREPAALFAAAA